jgi:tRNA dimethylallyltransferase
MKGIGYREFRDYFSGAQTLAQTRDRIVGSTLQLAKKQRTWFKRNDAIHWIGPSEQNGEPGQIQQAEAVALVTTFLNK